MINCYFSAFYAKELIMLTSCSDLVLINIPFKFLFTIKISVYFPKSFLKFLATMLGLLSFLFPWTLWISMCSGRSVSTVGEDTITTGAIWTGLPLLEMPRSRKYVDISSLCHDLRLPPSGSSSCRWRDDFLGDDWRLLSAVRGLLSSKLEVLWKRLIIQKNTAKLYIPFKYFAFSSASFPFPRKPVKMCKDCISRFKLEGKLVL